MPEPWVPVEIAPTRVTSDIVGSLEDKKYCDYKIEGFFDKTKALTQARQDHFVEELCLTYKV